MHSQNDVTRARWQLWAVAFSIMIALAIVLVVISTAEQPAQDAAFLPPRALLGMALGGMIAAFLLYAVDRERNLHRLAERVVAEQIESERLATRLQYLAELARERDTNAALIDGAADGVAVVDSNLTILRFNRAMETLTGVRATDALGSRADDVFRFLGSNDEALVAEAHPLHATLDDGAARPNVELRLVSSDGSERWVGATFSPIVDQDAGNPTLVLLLIRDIAQRKEQEVLHRDFVSMAAHELRSPLTAIKGFARTLMLKHDKLTDQRRTEYLRTVSEQSDRLARLVDDLMQVSRIDSGRVRIEPEPVTAGDVARELVAQFRSKWSDRVIEVIEEDSLPDALADRHKLEEILINLIDNAIKYSPEGSPVRVLMRPSPGGVQISVRDRGLGIPAADIPHLFQKFHRLPAATAADVPGTGLGLYIVKGLVEAHGGTVWVDSVPGTGTTFSFTIPAAAIRRAPRLAQA